METYQLIAASMLLPVAAKAWRACASENPIEVIAASALMFLCCEYVFMGALVFCHMQKSIL